MTKIKKLMLEIGVSNEMISYTLAKLSNQNKEFFEDDTVFLSGNGNGNGNGFNLS